MDHINLALLPDGKIFHIDSTYKIVKYCFPIMVYEGEFDKLTRFLYAHSKNHIPDNISYIFIAKFDKKFVIFRKIMENKIKTSRHYRLSRKICLCQSVFHDTVTTSLGI
ncbi:hypothetical protein BpHYR1_021656 [Brachionus plicatilis]|uniref:Uncharacterized protein n=1 Tax=Brachionus plicatilis TaxID=10195 RepID=A0A3M7RV68_BRAPC|nr:hypothetical protein BpHYR1_021656 [Brachionus plicatilis]